MALNVFNNDEFETKYVIRILIFDSILGTVFGLMAFRHQLYGSLIENSGSLEFLNTLTSPHFGSQSMFLDIIPILLSTLTLAPLLIYYLGTQFPIDKKVPYYLKSALGGFLLAVIGCGTTGFFLGLITAVRSIGGGFVGSVTAIIFGPILMFIGCLFTFPIYFFEELLVLGVIFGLVNGRLIEYVVDKYSLY